MQIIVLDTNIFIQENFLEGKRIQELFKLCKNGSIKLLVTEITVKEVKKKFLDFSKIGLENLGQFRNKIESRAIRNIEACHKLFEKPNINELTKVFDLKFDKTLKDTKIEMISYDSIQIERIFEKYFARENPFHNKSKKSEFPDAFSMELIDKWCIENLKKVIVFTKDKDFRKFGSDNFIVEGNYEVFLDKLLKEILNQEALDVAYENNSHKIDASLIDFFKDEFDDFSNLYKLTYYEIHDVLNIEISVTEKNYQIISIENDEEIEIEIQSVLEYKIELEIDDVNHSFWDSDTKSHHYLETTNEVFTGQVNAYANFVIYIYDKEVEESEIELKSVQADYRIVEDE